MILYRRRFSHFRKNLVRFLYATPTLLVLAVVFLASIWIYPALKTQHTDAQRASQQLPEYVEEHALPVVLLETDPQNLWDEQSGIYTNYDKEGDDWERPAKITLYEADGSFGFSQVVGIRIHGGGSTAHPQKSLRIYGEYEHHETPIQYPLFPERPYDRYRSIILRAGGGDWSGAFIRDSVAHTLAENYTDLDTQAVKPAVLYLNGEYWGLYHIRERYDQGYIQYKYGLDPSKIAIIEVLHDIGVNRGEAAHDFGQDTSAADDYNEILAHGKNCTTCADSNYVGKVMDLDNLLEYYFVELYAGNFDWPYGNVKLWRYRQPKFSDEQVSDPIDGKFRWLLYDLDVGFGFKATNSAEMYEKAATNPYDRFLDDRMPFRNLFYNESFQQRYLTRTAELLNDEFSADSVIAVIDERAAAIRSEMPRHLERWRGEAAPLGTKVVDSYDIWEEKIEELRIFARERPQHMFAQTITEFELTSTQDITFDTQPAEAGTITIGRLSLKNKELPWTGRFFSDTYMALEAHPAPGYRFDHWEGDVPQGMKYDKRIVLKLEDRESFTAVYRKRHWFELL